MAPKKRDCRCPPRRHREDKDERHACDARRGFKCIDMHRLRSRTHKLNVTDLVYKFLGNVACMTAKRRRRNNAPKNFNRTHVRRTRFHQRRPDGPHNCRIARFVGDGPKANRTRIRRTERSVAILKRSRIDDRTFTRDDSSTPIQLLKESIDANDEGKRHAKKYMRKALSFGVGNGYLIPTEGHMLRVSSALIGSHRRRKIARDAERVKRATMRPRPLDESRGNKMRKPPCERWRDSTGSSSNKHCEKGPGNENVRSMSPGHDTIRPNRRRRLMKPKSSEQRRKHGKR